MSGCEGVWTPEGSPELAPDVTWLLNCSGLGGVVNGTMLLPSLSFRLLLELLEWDREGFKGNGMGGV